MCQGMGAGGAPVSKIVNSYAKKLNSQRHQNMWLLVSCSSHMTSKFWYLIIFDPDLIASNPDPDSHTHYPDPDLITVVPNPGLDFITSNPDSCLMSLQV